MEPDRVDAHERLQKITELKRAKDEAAAALDRELRLAVEQGVRYSALSGALGYTEAAVRLRANRKGWRRG